MSIQITLLGHSPKKREGYSSRGNGDGGEMRFIHQAWANSEEGEGFTKDNHDEEGHIVFYRYLGICLSDERDDESLSFNSYVWTLLGDGDVGEHYEADDGSEDDGDKEDTCPCKYCCNFKYCGDPDDDNPWNPHNPDDPSVDPSNPDDPSVDPSNPDDPDSPTSGPVIDIWCDLDPCEGLVYFANVISYFMPYMPDSVKETEPVSQRMIALREFFGGNNMYTPDVKLYDITWVYRWKASSYEALVAQLPKNVGHTSDPTPASGSPYYAEGNNHPHLYISSTLGLAGTINERDNGVSEYVLSQPTQVGGSNSRYGTDVDFSGSAVASHLTRTTIPIQFFNGYSTSDLPPCLS